MNTGSRNIFPVFDRILPRSEKEALLRQRARVIWLTGLPAAGKTSIAIELERCMHQSGYLVKVLDADNVRSGLNGDLGFSEEDRKENIRRISEVSKLFVDAGVITINCFITPTESIRKIARDILGDDLIEIFVDTPVEVCEQRDVKGLYAEARRGELANFTGVNAPFERPLNPSMRISNDSHSIPGTVAEILKYVKPLITVAL